MAVDIFRQMEQLFRKDPIEGEMNTFVLHRFLASDPTFASFAKQIGNNLRDDSLVVEVWKTALPRMAKAPYFKYPAPKKGPAAEELSKRVMEIENLNQVEADEAVAMFATMGLTEVAHRYYGVEQKKSDPPATH